ncbi:MAG: hypothetical protein K0S86_5224 [Geminicoccaceae bacterium]|nr:hypothetical protein [Geminicoccaceae bacterium]
MYSPAARLVLTLASLVGAAWSFARGLPLAWLFLAAAALFALGYWRNAAVWRAWRAWQRGDLAAVAHHLRATPAPERLAPQQRAYYEWLKAEVLRDAGDAQGACVHFGRAVEGRLRTSADRALALSRLAEAAFMVGDIEGARGAIARARALDPPPFVQALLADLEHAMAAA